MPIIQFNDFPNNFEWKFRMSRVAIKSPSVLIYYFIQCCIAFAFFLVLAGAAWADSHVSGVLQQDTLWSKAESPYWIDNDVTVQNGAKLTIEAGVHIFVAAGRSLTVASGSLQALGTAAEPILVTSWRKGQQQSPVAGDWGSLVLNLGAINSRLEHVVIEYGRGVLINGAAPTFSYVTLQHHLGAAMALDRLASPVGRGNKAQNNDINAIVVPAGDLTGSIRWGIVGIPYLVEGTVSVGASPWLNASTPIALQKGRTAILNVTGQRLSGLGNLSFDVAGVMASVLPGATDTAASISLSADENVALGPISLRAMTDAGEVNLANALNIVAKQPLLTGLNPANVMVGQGTLVMNLLGDSITNKAVLLLDGEPTSSAFVDSNHLTFTLPNQMAAVSHTLQLQTTDDLQASTSGFSNLFSFISAPQPLQFNTSALTVEKGASTSVTLRLQYPAPAGGLSIQLTSSNISIANVPPTVFFAEGIVTQTLAIVGVGAGSAMITASHNGFVSAMLDATVSSKDDPYWDRVLLAMPMDGVEGSKNFIDLKKHLITANGNAKISTLDGKFGTASASLSGGGDYLSAPFVWNEINSEDWTVELWMKPTDYSGRPSILHFNNGTHQGLHLHIVSTGFVQVDNGAVAVESGSIPIVENQWVHLAVVKSNGKILTFLNGVLDSTRVAQSYVTPTTLQIGRYSMGSVIGDFKGFIDDVRVTRGIARYTTGFTPPGKIEAANTAPVIGNYEVKGVVGMQLNGRAVARDSDGDLLTYAKSSDPFHGSVSVSADGSWRYIPEVDFVGTDAFSVEVTDDRGGVARSTISIGIANADPYWDKVVLAMHMDGENGSTSFIDEKGHVVKAMGAASISTKASKIGGASGQFDAVGKFLSINDSADFTFALANFTVEAWVRPSTTSTINGTIISHRLFDGAPDQGFLLGRNGSTGKLWFLAADESTVNVELSSKTTIAVDTWYHVAVTRSGNTFRLFVNGIQEASATFSGSMYDTGNVLTIGDNYDGARPFMGNIDELRITNGVARYMSNFTPSGKAFPNIKDESIDPYADNVLLGLHFDAGTGFSDVKGNIGTLVGSPSINTNVMKFGDASGYFPGNGSYQQFNSALGDLGSGAFTIETWVNLPSGASYFGNEVPLISAGYKTTGLGSGGWNLILVDGPSGAVRLERAGIDEATAVSVIGFISGAIPRDTWLHVAATRLSNGEAKVFLNGKLLATSNVISGKPMYIPVTSNKLYVGAGANSLSPTYWPFAGYLDDLRITKGVARYTEDFTLPSQTFSNIKDEFIDPFWDKTVLAMPMDGANAANIFVDHKLHIPSAVGQAQTSTVEPKFGTAAAKFDGNGDYISLPGSNDFAFGDGDFTVETWVFLAANSLPDGAGNKFAYLFTLDGGGGRPFSFEVLGDANRSGTGLGLYDGSAFVSASAEISQSAWHHVAVSRQANTLRFFLDGVLIGSTVRAHTFTSTSLATIGGSPYGGAYNGYLNGYMDDIRVTKGTARYIQNFTPPAYPMSIVGP